MKFRGAFQSISKNWVQCTPLPPLTHPLHTTYSFIETSKMFLKSLQIAIGVIALFDINCQVGGYWFGLLLTVFMKPPNATLLWFQSHNHWECQKHFWNGENIKDFQSRKHWIQILLNLMCRKLLKQAMINKVFWFTDKFLQFKLKAVKSF